MKGLIPKDFYGLLTNKKASIIMIFVVVLLSIGLDMGTAFISSMLMMYLILVSGTLFTLDDASNWNCYAIAMPVSRRQIVASRYISVLLVLGLVVLFGLALSGGLSVFMGQQNWLTPLLITTLVMLLISLFIFSVSFPISYRVGADKARYITLVVYLIPILLFVFLDKQFGYAIGTLSSTTLVSLLVAGFALVLVLYVASFFLSLRMLRKREF